MVTPKLKDCTSIRGWLTVFCKMLMHLYFCAVLKFTFLLILIKDIETIYLNHVNGTLGIFSDLPSASQTHIVCCSNFFVCNINIWTFQSGIEPKRVTEVFISFCALLEILIIYSWKYRIKTYVFQATWSLVPKFRKHLINELVKAFNSYKNSLSIWD